MVPNGTRTRPHNQSTKMTTFGEASGTIFNEFLVSTWPPRGVTDLYKHRYFLALGAFLEPRWPQEAHKTDFRAILEPFWSRLGPNLAPTWPNLAPLWLQLGASLVHFGTQPTNRTFRSAVAGMARRETGYPAPPYFRSNWHPS